MWCSKTARAKEYPKLRPTLLVMNIKGMSHWQSCHKRDHQYKNGFPVNYRQTTVFFSKLKDNAIPEMRTLHKIVRDAFALDTNTLDEKGNLSLSDLRTFILSDDLCRTYMANLGTEIAVVDTGKLVIQRAQTTAKLAEIENELKLLK